MTRESFEKWVHRYGIATGVIVLGLMIAFPVTVSTIYGIWPNFGDIWPAIVTVVALLAPWWPGECIGYMTTMGPGALYLSYITGNVTNLRMPATVGTMNSLGIEPNTDECHTMAIIACGASNFVSIGILFLGLILSVPLQPVLNAEVLQPAYNFAIPALFGGMVAQSVLKTKKGFGLYLIPLAVCLFFCFFTTVNSAYYMLITVAVGALAYYFLDYHKNQTKAEAEG